jgi:hypothetical protein
VTIDVTAPHTAPARADLPFLRHRTTRVRPAPSAVPVAASLDLADDPVAAPRVALPLARIAARDRAVLTPMAPMIALTRLQSAIGVLTVDAMWSDPAGDPHIGCVYAMVGGHTTNVRHDGPHDPRSPVTLGVRQRFERLTIDLRQSRGLARLIVYRVPAAGRPRGTIVTTTYVGARVELPVDQVAPGGVTVLMSIYNLDGEFVLRAELDTVDGTVRDACEAYGFDNIAWW